MLYVKDTFSLPDSNPTTTLSEYVMPQIIKKLNKVRREHKEQWFTYAVEIWYKGNHVATISYKVFNTWVQTALLKIDVNFVVDVAYGSTIHDSSAMELSVKGFVDWVTNITDYFVKHLSKQINGLDNGKITI